MGATTATGVGETPWGKGCPWGWGELTEEGMWTTC